MKRLTIKTPIGAALKMNNTYLSEDATREDLMKLYRVAVERLAAYEDTGLTPKEIPARKQGGESSMVNTVGRHASTNWRNHRTMSEWVYVDGMIEIDTNSRSDAESMYIAQSVVNHLPQVHGSEGNVEYYLSLKNEDSDYDYKDEFGNLSNLTRGETAYSDFRWQTQVIIAVHGELRDTNFDAALREMTNMLNWLSSRIYVNTCLVRVRSYGREFIFRDSNREFKSSWIAGRSVNDWVQNCFRQKGELKP